MNMGYLRALPCLIFIGSLLEHASAEDAHVNAVSPRNLTAPSTSSLSTFTYVIDSRFAVIPTYIDTETEHNLNLSGVLIDATNAMCAMALQPYEGNMAETVWVYDMFPTVQIKIGNNAPMPRRFGIWGLELCIRGMVSRLRFDGIICKLYWNHGYVGTVEIANNDVPAGSMAVAAAATNNASSATSFPQNASSLAAIPLLSYPPAPASWTDPQLSLSNMRPSNAITIYDAFLTVLSTTRRIAYMEPHDPLEADVITDPNTKLDVIYGSSGRTPANPPYFEAQWLFKSLPMISKNFVLSGAFTEILLNVNVDAIKVATMAINRRWTNDGGLIGPAQNGTTA